MGSRKTVPFRMFRIVPFGLFHISFSLNSVQGQHTMHAHQPASRATHSQVRALGTGTQVPYSGKPRQGMEKTGSQCGLPTTRCSSGVIVAHLIPTLNFCTPQHHHEREDTTYEYPVRSPPAAPSTFFRTLIALAASMVTWSLVLSRLGSPRS